MSLVARSSTRRPSLKRCSPDGWREQSSTCSKRSRCRRITRSGMPPMSPSRRTSPAPPSNSWTTWSSRTSGATWPASRCSIQSTRNADTEDQEDVVDEGERVTRLGSDGAGRGRGIGDARVYHWEWGPDDARRPGLPWIGIFLLVFGGLLLVQQAYPELNSAGSLLVLAIGLAFLVKWLLDRGIGSLYAGAIITALAAPGVLNAAGIVADGLGTFSFGVAFLFIAAVRVVSGGGWGWQLWFGGLLALGGGASISSPGAGGLCVPLLLVV